MIMENLTPIMLCRSPADLLNTHTVNKLSTYTDSTDIMTHITHTRVSCNGDLWNARKKNSIRYLKFLIDQQEARNSHRTGRRRSCGRSTVAAAGGREPATNEFRVATCDLGYFVILGQWQMRRWKPVRGSSWSIDYNTKAKAGTWVSTKPFIFFF